MTSQDFFALVAFALLATGSPGGATALATASGARFGLRRSLRLAGGIAAGVAGLAAASALGLASLLIGLPSLRLALKLAGTAYLLWLAWSIAGSGAPRAAGDREAPLGFWNGVLLLWLNPKAWAVTLAAGASFGAAGGEPGTTALLLGATFGAAAALSMTLWCGAGLLLGRLLRSERQWRALNALLGLLLAASVLPIWLE